MALTLNQIAALAGDATFRGQCQAAALAEANTKIHAAPSGNAAVDAASYHLAQQIIQDGCDALLNRVAWGIASTPGFAAITDDANDANDAAIASAMVSQWPVLSLITGAQSA